VNHDLEAQVEKMSKSKLNVVNPDEVIEAYGADAMRLYELFMGPLEVQKPWQMNTAIAQMMIFTNDPHICEELWQRLGEGELIAHAEWPSWDPELAQDEMITIVIQVNGKKRDELQVSRDATNDELERLALASENAQRFLDGREPKKVIVVPGRLVNIVV
jgi:leucyl-tRNA synthetase